MRGYPAVRRIGLLGMFLFLSACSNDYVVVVPGKDGKSGAVVVHQDGKSLVLDKPYAAARIGGWGGAAPTTMDPKEVTSAFADSVAALPEPPVSFSLYFTAGGTQLAPESLAVMEQVVATFGKRPAAEVTVIGHTDRVGPVSDNDGLSLERAKSVVQTLAKRGLKTEKIEVAGRGEREPLIPTADEKEEPRNRRTEISIR